MEHAASDRVAQLEDQVSRLTGLVEDLRAERLDRAHVASGNGKVSKRSRRDLLKLAGAAAAGAAGVTLAGARGVTNAYAATTDTNFTANGTATTGFDATGTFSNGVYGRGTFTGIAASGGTLAGYFLGGTRASMWISPRGTAGAPTGGNHYQGDLVVDANGVIWMCTSGNGIPADTFAPVQQGGINNAIYTAVSQQQYLLGGSNGVTWQDIDGTNLKLVITPTMNARAIFYANADLWTDTSGVNQDIAVTVNNTVHSWKESGGGAGTFSPNAAFVHGVFGDFFKGTTYTVKLQWKANKPTTTAQHIACGAGPIGGLFSPTRLSVQLITI